VIEIYDKFSNGKRGLTCHERAGEHLDENEHEHVPTSIPNYSIGCKDLNSLTQWAAESTKQHEHEHVRVQPRRSATTSVSSYSNLSGGLSLIFLLKVIQMPSPGILLATRTRTRTWLPAIVNLQLYSDLLKTSSELNDAEPHSPASNTNTNPRHEHEHEQLASSCLPKCYVWINQKMDSVYIL
jgi:hypothetical protein